MCKTYSGYIFALATIGITATVCAYMVLIPMDVVDFDIVITNCKFYDEQYANNMCEYKDYCCSVDKLCDMDDCYKIWFYAKLADGYSTCVETFGLTSKNNTSINLYLQQYINKTMRCKSIRYGEAILVADDGRTDTYTVDKKTAELVYKYSLITVCFIVSIVLMVISTRSKSGCVIGGISGINSDNAVGGISAGGGMSFDM